MPELRLPEAKFLITTINLGYRVQVEKNGAPSFLIVMSPNLDPVIHFSDLMRENLVANEVVRKVNFRLAIHGNVA